MTGESLEVKLNLDERYQEGEGQFGRLTKFVNSGEQERYLGGTFRELISYVLKDPGSMEQEQKNVRSAVQELMDSASEENMFIIRLYDEDDGPMEGQFNPGETYLNDIVSDKVGDDVDCINLGVYTRPKVG